MREIVKKVLINDSIDPIKMPGTEVSFPRQEYDMKLEALIQNMTDQIKEAQLKLGYARETMRLYYPLSSLNAMLEMQETDIRELAKKIRHELEAKKEKMGDTVLFYVLKIWQALQPPKAPRYMSYSFTSRYSSCVGCFSSIF